MVLIFIKSVKGDQFSLDVKGTDTVRTLKKYITRQTQVPRRRQRLIFRGNVLKEEEILDTYNISKECSIQLFTISNKANILDVDQNNSNSSSETTSVLPLPTPKNNNSANNNHFDNVSPYLQFGDVVLIQLIEGKDLKKSDFWTGSSDPYVILAMGCFSSKSKIIKRNLNPQWNEMFVFAVDRPSPPPMPPQLEMNESTSEQQSPEKSAADPGYTVNRTRSTSFLSSFRRSADSILSPQQSLSNLLSPKKSKTSSRGRSSSQPEVSRKAANSVAEVANEEILSFIVFDHDTFTPDDFLGSAEIRLDHLPLNTVVDLWIPLDHVETGHIHVKLRRCGLASPIHRSIVLKLMQTERSITVKDLQAHSITLDQLVGEEAWICADLSNPAIEHLVSVLLANQIDWTRSTLQRIERILTSQHMLPTPGPPTRYIWFSGLDFSTTSAGREEENDDSLHTKYSFLRAIEQYATPKRCFLLKGNTEVSFALLEFKSFRDALLVFIMFQHRRNEAQRMLLGFGRHLPLLEGMVDESRLGGFLNIYDMEQKTWQLCWCFLTDSILYCYHDLQSDIATCEIQIADGIICSRGPSSVEVFDTKTRTSTFIYSHCASQMKEWLTEFQSISKAQRNKSVVSADTNDESLQQICGNEKITELPPDSITLKGVSTSQPIRDSDQKTEQTTATNELSTLEMKKQESDVIPGVTPTSEAAPNQSDHIDATPKTQTITPDSPKEEPQPPQQEEVVVDGDDDDEEIIEMSPPPEEQECILHQSLDDAQLIDDHGILCLRNLLSPVEEDGDVYVECNRCTKKIPVVKMFCPDPQSTPSCIECLRKDILEQLSSENSKSLTKQYSIHDLRELLQKEEFEKYLDFSLKDLLESASHFIKCPDCEATWEFVRGRVDDAPDFEKLTGLNNKLLNTEAEMHYMSHRACCRQCTTNFCRECGESPYHAGFNCEFYQMYKTAKKCRFCTTALMPDVVAPDPPSAALANVCNNPLCLDKRDQSCTKTLPCGHFCTGVRDEKQCMPCIEDCASKPPYINQNVEDYCSICYTETLENAPCIALECGHVFHYECSKKRLHERWNGPQIKFGFVECPLCKIRMEHPLLEAYLEPVQKVHRELEKQAYGQLLAEKLLDEVDLSDESHHFHKNPVGFAMEKLAFYDCYICKKPYYGGQVRCLDGLEAINESDFICPACSGIGLDTCTVHGRDYMVYKCRFCCSVSSYFCWGTTHFCHDCHKRQENHDYMTTKPKESLPKCDGSEKCPLKLEHPPNGEEFSLGCSLCRGADSFGKHVVTGSVPVPLEIGILPPVAPVLEIDDDLANPDKPREPEGGFIEGDPIAAAFAAVREIDECKEDDDNSEGGSSEVVARER